MWERVGFSLGVTLPPHLLIAPPLMERARSALVKPLTFNTHLSSDLLHVCGIDPMGCCVLKEPRRRLVWSGARRPPERIICGGKPNLLPSCGEDRRGQVGHPRSACGCDNKENRNRGMSRKPHRKQRDVTANTSQRGEQADITSLC